MPDPGFFVRQRSALDEIERQKRTKRERLIASAQAGHVVLIEGGKSRQLLNFCANNYLGLADSPDLSDAAILALDKFGFGTASVRFICGTMEIHRRLEERLAQFLGFEDAITFAACFDANGAVFEPLFEAEDAIISDALNHASIIDGIRLCKARRYRFENRDMNDLEQKLKQAIADGARTKVIVTDGVFSMDGFIADLRAICDLADRYDALVMVDDCHATGVLGQSGRGSAEYWGVEGRIDILTGTLGKALGGAMGGYICARRVVIDALRQRARPYLFSNALAPALAAGALRAIDLVENSEMRRRLLFQNAEQFRSGLSQSSFDLLEGSHPIIPVMLPGNGIAQAMAERLLELGVLVTAFSYPVVPQGRERIRVQMNAMHSSKDVGIAVDAFIRAGRELGVISPRSR